MRISLARAVPFLALLALSAAPARPSRPEHVEVVPGVHLFRTAPYGDVGLDGNSVAIVGDDGVLVFDANGTPAAARAVLAEIRRVTPKPVRWLVLSHWHWDHWYGAEIYARAFPGLAIVAHERTRALMAGPAIEFNRPGLDEQLPAHVREVEAELAAARRANPGSAAVAEAERHLANDRAFLDAKRSVRHTLPNVTFTDSLTIRLGAREVRVLHVDRAITPGDAMLWLPTERVMVCGDVLINPVTFALFCYPDGWIRTLEHLDARDAAVLVPGHGAPMREESLLHATRDLLLRERTVVRAARERGRTREQAVEDVMADAEVLRLRDGITGGDAARHEAFAVYLVRWFVTRAYDEAVGPLDDRIPSVVP